MTDIPKNDVPEIGPDQYDAVRDRARELCEQAGLEPDVWVHAGYDDIGFSIKEQNWELFVEKAQEAIQAETQA